MSPTPDQTPRLPATIYCRISKDRAGAGLGVERQEADCRDLAARLGWDVVAVFVDNDISAYSGQRRPQYELMLRAVRDGEIAAILAWHPDRLHRRALELEEFVTVAETHGTQVQTVSAGTVDLSTASGRMVARMLGAAAQHEVDHARERMRRAKSQAAADGRYRGGPRPFGFDADGVTIREDEAQVIREATTAVLAGRSLAAVARDLGDRGVKTSVGKPWTYQRLRDVLIRPRNAGLINHGRPDRPDYRPGYFAGFEIVGKASWQPIVDEDTWRAVHALLLDPSRRVHTSTEPRWLGSNTYECGRPGCHALMRTTSSGGSQGRRYHYRCAEQNHLSVAAPKTDEYVREVVAELVRDPRVVAAMSVGDGDAMQADRARRATLTTSLEQTEIDYDHDLIDARRYKAKTDRLTAEITEIDAQLATGLQRSLTSKVMRAPDPGAAFLAAPVDVQRAVLRAVLRVQVQPVAKRGDKWSSDRLVLSPVVAAGEA
ncbi:MAG: recombinase family protein [Streptosporangiales bacterium]|nr:recombinase family protein [Streptosporangiales bacterium]